MKASKFTDAQKAFILRQSEEGVPVAEICRKDAFLAGMPTMGRHNAALYSTHSTSPARTDRS